MKNYIFTHQICYKLQMDLHANESKSGNESKGLSCQFQPIVYVIHLSCKIKQKKYETHTITVAYGIKLVYSTHNFCKNDKLFSKVSEESQETIEFCLPISANCS